MSHNPLLGSRISLISKKSIRYEGTLYSISESDATVALQNVRTYGTEGREGDAQFVPPQEGVVHPYLLFRGCDIKDLHVHENKDTEDEDVNNPAGNDSGAVTATASANDSNVDQKNNENINKEKGPTNEASTTPGVDTDEPVESNEDKDKRRRRRSVPKVEVTSDITAREEKDEGRKQEEKERNNGQKQRKNDTVMPTQQSSNGSNVSSNKGINTNGKGRVIGNRRGKRDPKQMVGTGASLLHRKARGAVEGVAGPDKNTPQEDYDFQSNLAEFDKSYVTPDPNCSSDVNNDDNLDEDEEDNEGHYSTPNGGGSCVYSKDNFFDSISSDVLDKKNGIDNRLRGSEERNLNTETFGAVSLGNGRRGGRRNRRGGGYGRGSGRGRGGRGRGRRGPRRENRRWNREGEANGMNGTTTSGGGDWSGNTNDGGFPVNG